MKPVVLALNGVLRFQLGLAPAAGRFLAAERVVPHRPPPTGGAW